MEKRFEFFIDRNRSQIGLDCYLIEHRGNGKHAYCSIAESGDIISTIIENEPALTSDVKPFFRLPLDPVFSPKAMFQAIAEGLKEYGIVAEVDNAQRITAQALADERGKTIKYFQSVNDKLVEKITR